MDILSITGGLRKTDNLELYPCPKKDEKGNYQATFFSRGISHLPKDTVERLNLLKTGDRLFIMKDLQNEFDPNALVLRTDDPVSFAGYCPRYFNADFNYLLNECNGKDVEVKVVKINPDAPYQLRLLCSISACWPTGFSPCEDELHQPLAEIETDEECSFHSFS